MTRPGVRCSIPSANGSGGSDPMPSCYSAERRPLRREDRCCISRRPPTAMGSATAKGRTPPGLRLRCSVTLIISALGAEMLWGLRAQRDRVEAERAAGDRLDLPGCRRRGTRRYYIDVQCRCPVLWVHRALTRCSPSGKWLCPRRRLPAAVRLLRRGQAVAPADDQSVGSDCARVVDGGVDLRKLTAWLRVALVPVSPPAFDSSL